MAANEIIGRGRQEKSNVVARVHQGGAHGSAFLGPIFGNEGCSDAPLSADADTS